MDESNENESETESSENEDDINYKLCCLFDKNENKCGPYIRDRSIKLGLVDMTNLNEDTEGHFCTSNCLYQLSNGPSEVSSKTDWEENLMIQHFSMIISS